MNTFLKKSNWIKLILGTTITLMILSISSTAFALGNTTYFGGKVLFTLPCTCDNGKTMVVIDDYASGNTIKLGYNRSELKTLFFNNYSPYMGHYLLGSYGGNDTCRIRILKYCLSIPLDGKFNSSPGTGTS